MSAPAELTFAVIDVIIAILGGAGAIVAYVVGLRQYQKGQRWQKAEFILRLIDAFEGDEEIRCACQMIDWDERDILLPNGQTVRFRNDMLVSALRVPKMDIEGVFTKEERTMRDAFDAFLDYFDKLYSLRVNRLVAFQDLTYFFYWFELIRDIGLYKQDYRIKASLDGYIRAYRFVGVHELLLEYSKSPNRLLIPPDSCQVSPRSHLHITNAPVPRDVP
ncbi:MAG: hypothetical protein ACYC35_25815 [Pirellulales bacterium]